MGYVSSMFAITVAALTMGATDAPVTVTDLRCAYRVDPLGIDRVNPRLSWRLESSKRGVVQTGYRILVADSEAALAADEGNLWDSGKVEAEQSALVPYEGNGLESRQRCYWKVRVWDNEGKASDWSPIAMWTMGLLKAEDWTGQWIGLDEEDSPGDTPLAAARWIWFPEGAPAQNAPAEARYFRKVVAVPENKAVSKATAYFAADNRFVLMLNEKRVASGNSFNAAPPVDVRKSLKPGRNVLAVEAVNDGEAANPAGLIGALIIEFKDGEKLAVVTDGTWRVTADSGADWYNPELDVSAWERAQDLGAFGMEPWGEVVTDESRRLSARYLRREFTLDKPIERAMVHLCGLGLFELELNGEKVGNDVLVPALTDYPTRAFYLTYDVTEALKQGENAIGVILGNGRYYAPRTKSPTNTLTYGYPKLMLNLRVEYSDGTFVDIDSGEAWKLTTDGPIRANNEYDGEIYDARMELTGWSTPDYDDSAWRSPEQVSGPEGVLSAQMTPPIRVIETRKPQSINEVEPGVFIYDMGQNMVGWCRLKVQGPKGTEVRLRHAETVKDDGTLYMANLRGAKCEDTYILKGGGEEVYEPRFTYHGFRYVEITGYPGTPGLDAIEGCVVHDDVERVGRFETSNPLLNQLHENIVWGIRGNYRSFPTDCPQRDERQAWLGDRSEECRGESYVYNIAPLYSKWMQDIDDSQKESGSISDVSPPYWPLYNDNVTWPSTFIIAPGMLYDQYGDSRPIEQHYDAMKRWITHMSGYLENDLMPRDNYGDWCVPPESPELIHSKDPSRKTSGMFLGTSYFHYDCKLMAKYAAMLGKKDDVAEFNALAKRLEEAFTKKYFKPEQNIYDNGTQTTSVLTLAFDLVPDGHREGVFNSLVTNIVEKTNSHIGTGLIGGQWLMRTLTNNGRPDLAYTLATNTTYPSWGYMIEQDATTIWELWNGDTADPAMNSHNHVMLVGDLLTWFYGYLAGIRPTPMAPGFQTAQIKPYVVGDLTHVKASVDTQYGRYASSWEKNGETLSLDVTVPPNCRTMVFVPTFGKNQPVITESGEPIWQEGKYLHGIDGISSARPEGDWIAFSVGSGEYRFVCR
ncbi:MAG: family 78 glycoside hydrolase catalytic domain [Candidatus Hydrogenedentota bacterium]